MLVTVWPAHAQYESQYKRGTPPQFAAGEGPLSSYISPDIGVVSLVNGGLNFKLPMGRVGGRGFSFPILLTYNSKVWSARKENEVSLSDFQEHPIVLANYRGFFVEPILNGSIELSAGWAVGVAPSLRATGMGIGRCLAKSTLPPYDFFSCGYRHALTKLTVVMPDGAEIQLRDDQSDGAPLPAQPVPGLPAYNAIDGYRGRRWHATDGSGAIFISDYDNAVARGHLAGVFITAGGMRYRFNDIGTPDPNLSADSIMKSVRCVSITDRHGNVITINYPNGDQTVINQIDIIDQLGRMTRLQKNVPDPENPSTNLALLVTLPGYQGQARYYKIKTGVMNQNYRSDINPVLPVIVGEHDPEGNRFAYPGPHTTLFDESHGRFQVRIDNYSIVTELVLPDSRSLKFKYNEFGEVAEAQMPTGGKVQYDYAYAGFLPSGVSRQIEVSVRYFRMNLYKIDRSVVARRTYADGVTLESAWSYNYTSTPGAVEVRATSAGGQLLLWQRHYFMSGGRDIFEDRESGELDGVISGTGYVAWTKGLENRTETLDASGAVIYTEQEIWAQRAPLDWSAVTPYADQQQPENDNRLIQSIKTLENGSAAKVEYNYDRYNNPIEVKEYDFDQTSTPIRRTVTSYVGTNIAGGQLFDYVGDDSIHLLRLPKERLVYGSSGGELARTVYEYDNYGSDGNHAPLLDYGSVVGHDPNFGSNRPARGNVTAVGRWLNTNGGSFLYSYSRYDTLGNVIAIKDPRGFVTTFSFVDDFGAGGDPGSGTGGPNGPTYSLPTLVTSPDPGNGSGAHTARSQYDFSTGLLTGFKDRNGLITKAEFNDAFNRLTKIISVKGVTNIEAQTAIYYAPQSNPYGVALSKNDVLTAIDRDALGDGILRSWTVTDGFGRTIESWTRHPQGDVKVATIYDGFGRVRQASNPHRNSETPVYTTTTYDLAGRLTSVTTPDGGAVSTAYNGNQTTVTDQAGKQRRSETDALGRLIKIIEDPAGLNYETFYSYDALGNLRLVTQGSQTRTFVYNSLSQLVSATNPESGKITYAYDENGNLKEKTDAREVKTTITYDALNRAISKVYAGLNSEGTAAANVTPPVNYFYDNYSALRPGSPSWPGTPSKGRLIGVTYGTGSDGTYYKYDAAARIVTNHQRQGTTNYVTAYTYNRAGAVTREDRGSPARRRNEMSYDEAGRLSVMGTSVYPFTGGSNLVSDISYTPFGALQSEKYGNGLMRSMGYNNRLQPTEIRLGRPGNPESVFTIYNIFGTANNVNGQDAEIALTQNNGNIARVKYSVNGALQYSQTFQYDQVNRLCYAVEHKNGEYNDASRAWYQTFNYDPFGNRGIDVENTSDNMDEANNALKLADFSAANNRITRAGFLYDSAGNLIAEPGKSYFYNAENKLVTATVAGGAVSQYFYDGNDHRVRKVAVGVATRFEYGKGGELLAEWNEANGAQIKDYFYSGGELLATTKTGATDKYEYATADHLGSPRAWTNDSGSLVPGGLHDYGPFGNELFAGVGTRTTDQGYAASAQQDGQRKQFGSKERDTETGWDYFLARYYSSMQERFTSPDLPTMDLVPANPQSMNRYAYVRNNPCRNVDPNGRCSVPSGLRGGQVGVCVEAFIATKNVPGIMGKITNAKGDNRGPDSDDFYKTSKIHVDFIVSKPFINGQGHLMSEPKVVAGVSEAGGASLQGKASAEITNVKVDDKAQTTQFTLTGSAQNGFAAANIPGAPGGTIDFKLDFTQSSEGKLSINQGTSTTKEYPTYEAYAYEVDDTGRVVVTTLFIRRESGNPDDLKKGQTPIPNSNFTGSRAIIPKKQ